MADSPAPPPSEPPPGTPRPNAPSSTSSPTFAVRPTASTQARWPGQFRLGRTALVLGGSAFGAGALLLVLGPLAQLASLFIGGVIGVVGGGVALVVGLIQFARGGQAVPAVKRRTAALVGAGVPIAIGLFLLGLAYSSG